MERTDDVRPRGLDALIPPRPTPTVTAPLGPPPDGLVDVRISFPPTAPRPVLLAVLRTFGMAAPPENADLKVALVVPGVTDLTGLLARVAETFGDQVSVQVGLLGAFDGDDADLPA